MHWKLLQNIGNWFHHIILVTKIDNLLQSIGTVALPLSDVRDQTNIL